MILCIFKYISVLISFKKFMANLPISGLTEHTNSNLSNEDLMLVSIKNPNENTNSFESKKIKISLFKDFINKLINEFVENYIDEYFRINNTSYPEDIVDLKSDNVGEYVVFKDRESFIDSIKDIECIKDGTFYNTNNGNVIFASGEIVIENSGLLECTVEIERELVDHLDSYEEPFDTPIPEVQNDDPVSPTNRVKDRIAVDIQERSVSTEGETVITTNYNYRNKFLNKYTPKCPIKIQFKSINGEWLDLCVFDNKESGIHKSNLIPITRGTIIRFIVLTSSINLKYFRTNSTEPLENNELDHDFNLEAVYERINFKLWKKPPIMSVEDMESSVQPEESNER